MYLGIDEAGRGPLIGNLYIVGVLVDNLDLIRDEKIKDSKLLTQKEREEIFNKFKDKVKWFYFEIKPNEIDKENLNDLEAKYIKKIIEEALKYSNDLKVFIDLPENKERFIKRLNLGNLNNIELILEHKADLKYKIVSLASIFAKVLREKHVKILKNKLGVDFGSGYPSDPKTRELIKKIKEDKNLKKKISPYLRKKWKTLKNLFNNSLFDFI